MNLIVAFVIAGSLLACELDSSTLATDPVSRILSLLFVALSVPGLAFVQTWFFSRQLANSIPASSEYEATLNRISICHTGVWFIASMLIVFSIKWQTVVRINWGLGDWILIDELVILAPIVLSLAASWAIFYECQKLLGRSINQSQNSPGRLFRSIFDRGRIEFVLTRFRVYFILSIVPILLFALLVDLTAIRHQHQHLFLMGYFVTGAILVLGFPVLLSWIWNVKQVDPPIPELESFADEHSLKIFGIRKWNTGNSVFNALVAGFLPWLRLIIVSDGLLNRFPKHEMLAILRHEAGHIRLCHLPVRIGFAVLPLLVFGVAESAGLPVQAKLNRMLHLPAQPEWLGLSVMYGIYLFGTVVWLSRKMEFEADYYAATYQSPSVNSNKAANHLLDALIRLASLYPDQLDKKSLLHPTLRKRMKRIVYIRDNPQKAARLRNQGKLQRVYFLFVLTAVMVFLLA